MARCDKCGHKDSGDGAGQVDGVCATCRLGRDVATAPIDRRTGSR